MPNIGHPRWNQTIRPWLLEGPAIGRVTSNSLLRGLLEPPSLTIYIEPLHCHFHWHHRLTLLHTTASPSDLWFYASLMRPLPAIQWETATIPLRPIPSSLFPQHSLLGLSNIFIIYYFPFSNNPHTDKEFGFTPVLPGCWLVSNTQQMLNKYQLNI